MGDVYLPIADVCSCEFRTIKGVEKKTKAAWINCEEQEGGGTFLICTGKIKMFGTQPCKTVLAGNML